MRLWLFSAILIVHSLCLTTVAQTISSHCLKECGGVSIPFPFGIGPGCSHNASFAITCRNNSTGLPKPYLDSIGGLEVVEIQLDLKSIVVMQAVSPLKCSLQEQTLMPLGKSLVETPFFITSVLAVVGCKAEVWLVDSSTNASSLVCRCRYTTFGCTGNNCCMIDPTTRGWAQELAIHYKTYEQGNGNDDDICGFSFLADPIWLMRNYSSPLNLSLQYTPMALSWPFTDIPIADNQGISCFKSSHVFLPTLDYSYLTLVNTSICNCKDGYEGNPYLPSGCQDIDECFNSTSNNCTVETTCVNTAGSYACLPVIESNRIKLMIIGISSGVGSLLMLIGTWICLKVIRKRIKASRKKKFFKHNGGLLLQQQLSSNDGGTERIKLFSSKELALATDRYNDNRILGRGGQGTVYKGMLHDGRIVAVKKSKKMEETDIEAFINEVVILSQINHRNVVKLLGCCLETEVPLLVYEFIPNGTLFQHIHDRNDEYFPLSWKMRVRIATEVAGVLSYLHNAASVPIYHRDIKSTNILLDDKYRAKVSDFGTSRSIAIDQTHLTTRVLGTFGYLDPEYFQTSQFTEKSDVYSFGVVMVELLTGEKAISKVRAETGRSLATHFLQSMEENNLSDILDPKILKESRMDEIVAVAKLAKRCLNLSGKRRPTMKELAAGLVGIQMMEDGSASPYNLEDIEFESIEIWEDYDFPSTSNRTNMNKSSKSPLLFSN